MEFVTTSEQETAALGARLAERLRPGDVVALYGYLGAGKTALVRGMARGLGIRTGVSSPTFTIVNEYLGPTPLFHFDMYRLAGAEELFEIGWEDYLLRGGICVVEWSENVEEAFPPETIRIAIEKTGEDTRRIRVTPPEGRELL